MFLLRNKKNYLSFITVTFSYLELCQVCLSPFQYFDIQITYANILQPSHNVYNRYVFDCILSFKAVETASRYISIYFLHSEQGFILCHTASVNSNAISCIMLRFFKSS